MPIGRSIFPLKQHVYNYSVETEIPQKLFSSAHTILSCHQTGNPIFTHLNKIKHFPSHLLQNENHEMNFQSTSPHISTQHFHLRQIFPARGRERSRPRFRPQHNIEQQLVLRAIAHASGEHSLSLCSFAHSFAASVSAHSANGTRGTRAASESSRARIESSSNRLSQPRARHVNDREQERVL